MNLCLFWAFPYKWNHAKTCDLLCLALLHSIRFSQVTPESEPFLEPICTEETEKLHEPQRLLKPEPWSRGHCLALSKVEK